MKSAEQPDGETGLTDSTWTDSTGNHKASDPNNWSSGTAPMPGDNLFVQGGSTLSVRDNNLQRDPLNLAPGGSGPVTLNMSSGAQVSVIDTASNVAVVANIRGHGTFGVDVDVAPVEFRSGAPVTVNLADHATLDGTFHMQLASLTISGGDYAKFINDGATVLKGVGAVIGVDVGGTGEFGVGSALPHPSPQFIASGYLEFAGRVSNGQTITVSGASISVVPTARLVIDRPDEFHGTVDLHNSSLTDLVGLAQADHWSYANDLLSIRNAGGKVIETLHVVSDALGSGIHGLSLSKTSAGDVLVRPGTDFGGSLVAPTT
jgi:hypothetical protein